MCFMHLGYTYIWKLSIVHSNIEFYWASYFISKSQASWLKEGSSVPKKIWHKLTDCKMNLKKENKFDVALFSLQKQSFLYLCIDNLLNSFYPWIFVPILPQPSRAYYPSA